MERPIQVKLKQISPTRDSSNQFCFFLSGLWIDFVNFESDHGKSKDVESVRHRALQTLEGSELKKKFSEAYENPAGEEGKDE